MISDKLLPSRIAATLLPLRFSPKRDFLVIKNQRENAPEDKQEKDREGDEPISSHPFFVTQGSQSFDASGGQVADEFWICSGGAANLIMETFPGGQQIVFSDTKIIEVR